MGISFGVASQDINIGSNNSNNTSGGNDFFFGFNNSNSQ